MTLWGQGRFRTYFRPSTLKDLEPSAGRFGACRVGDLGKVDDDRTPMLSTDSWAGTGSVTILLVNLNSNGATCCDGAFAGRGTTVGIASNVARRDVLNRRVGVWKTDTSGLVISVTNPELLEGSVSSDLLGREGSEGCGDGELHCGR
jgi:hypothetical protein